MTTTADRWTGSWVGHRLGVRLESPGPSEVGLEVADLVGLALRRNPRRAHLLVSRVLGKHVPTDPRVVEGAGRLLGLAVAGRLGVTVPGLPGAGALVRAALAGAPDAVRELVRFSAAGVPAGALPAGTVVVGFAETATGLGHSVASALGAAYVHSTRRRPPGTPLTRFLEEHSHATGHALAPADPGLLTGDGPVVLVDDELSTGRTARNALAGLRRVRRTDQVVLASLVDLRGDGQDPAPAVPLPTAEAGFEHGVEAVSLARGAIRLPEGLPAAAAALLDALPDQGLPGRPATGTSPAGAVRPLPGAHWAGVVVSGRHGTVPADEPALRTAAARSAADLAPGLHGDDVLVLATEELMHAPLLVATALAELTEPDGVRVRFSSTTRSPVACVPEPGYAVRTGLAFPAHDVAAIDDPDGPLTRYAYNVPADVSDVLVVVDRPADTAALHAPGGLLDRVGAHGAGVHLLVVGDR